MLKKREDLKVNVIFLSIFRMSLLLELNNWLLSHMNFYKVLSQSTQRQILFGFKKNIKIMDPGISLDQEFKV